MKMVGRYSFLSNFFYARVKRYPSVEHAYQAGKTLDKAWRERIRNAPSSGKAKALGRKAPLRADWEEIKFDLMLYCVREKFKNPELARKLIAVEEPIVEHNTWHDNIWGSCVCPRCGNKGENNLGKILELVKKELTPSG